MRYVRLALFLASYERHFRHYNDIARTRFEEDKMAGNKVWFITGAGSGIGTGIGKAALRAGDRVVATGRNLDKLRNAFQDVAGDNLTFVGLDVADAAQAKSAVEEA